MREESRMCHQGLLSPLGMETESEERSRWYSTDLGMRLGRWTWRNGGICEYLQLAYLLHWPKWPGGPRKCLLELVAGI